MHRAPTGLVFFWKGAPSYPPPRTGEELLFYSPSCKGEELLSYSPPSTGEIEGGKLRHQQKIGQRGYTFIEMAVVLAIVALTVAFLAASSSIFKKGASLKAGARDIMQTLNTSRRLAISNRRVCAVVFDLNHIPTQYWIAYYDPVFNGGTSEQDANGNGEVDTEEDVGLDGNPGTGDMGEGNGIFDVADATDNPTYTPWDIEGKKFTLPESIIVTDISNNIIGSEDTNFSGILEAGEDVGLDGMKEGDSGYVAPDAFESTGSTSGDPIFQYVKLYPSGMGTSAQIHLWHTGKGEPTPVPSEKLNLMPFHVRTYGYPPGLTPKAGLSLQGPGTPDQKQFFELYALPPVGTPLTETPDSEKYDTLYYTVEVQSFTGKVTVYDYARGDGIDQRFWNKVKDGALASS